MRDDLPRPWWSIFDYLDQDVWWHPRELAAPVRIATMEPSHQRNLLRFLRRHANGLIGAHIIWSLKAFRDAPEEVQWGLEGEFEQIVDDPSAWLEGQPLVRRLRDLVGMRATLGGGPDWWEEGTRDLAPALVNRLVHQIHDQGA